VEFLKIVGFSILASISYGILHDLVTAHLCVEYFTIGHPPIFPTQSPFLLAIGWGILATWWVGLIIGLLVGCCARIGKARKLRFAETRPPLVRLLAVMASSALIAGLVGAGLASMGLITLSQSLFDAVPHPMHVRFLADLWAHSASYLSGLAGSLIISIHLWRQRALAISSAT
jgi:hypothetical protein